MSKAGFDALYREHYARILGLCRRILGGVADAEDATQEVFMRGYQTFDNYRTTEPFGPWIGTIATNHCIDILRRHRRMAGIFAENAANEADATDSVENGVGALISAHETAVIARAVEALPEKFRLPIVLAYYAEASYAEIARALDITANHVGVLLVRGKQHLRSDLAKLNEEN